MPLIVTVSSIVFGMLESRFLKELRREGARASVLFVARARAFRSYDAQKGFTALRGLQMQSGRFTRILKLEYVFLFITFVANTLCAQAQDFGQALGNNTGQSSTCSPTDPNCQSDNSQSTDQGNFQGRGSNQGNQQLQNMQGIALPAPTGNQQNNNSLYSSRAQQEELSREARLLLDSPTEFQLMVANSTGKMLPIFGAKLFRVPPSTFAPLDMVPVTPDYVVGPGDELMIQVWGQVTLNGRFMVDRTGNIYIPQAGTIHVAGQTFGQMQDYLKGQMGKIFRNFDLNVNMGQLRSIQVFVVGQARRPGNYTVSSLSTLVNALFATGGPTPQGSMRHIQLKRGGKVIVDYDLYDLLQHGDKSNDSQLLPGDVIYIPPVGPQVAVAGSVKEPGIYELKSGADSTVEDAISLAAGLTNVAANEKAQLERVDEARMRSMVEISLDHAGRSTVLRSGDILEFGTVVNRYKDAVTLRGNVANPGRFMWKPGMRVHDLFPDKDALITRDYWLKRSQLGQPTLTYIPTCPPNTPYGIPNLRYGVAAGEGGEDSLWRYSATKNPNLVGLEFSNQSDRLGRNANNFNKNDLSQGPPTDGGLDCGQQIEPSALSLGWNDRSNTNSSSNSSNSANPSNSSNSSNSNPQNSSNSLNSSNGSTQQSQQYSSNSDRISSANASVSGSSGQFLPRNDVKQSEPDIDWSYAVIERQSKQDLTTSLLPFNLGKVVLQGDASQNLELEPGDVVTIFSTADIHVPQMQQTKFVRLEGEFASAGIYSVLPGETLRQLVQRAGGLTSEAYLFGSEFTRESTRRVQQQRLIEYVDQIELQASTNATTGQNSAINAQDSAAATAAQLQAQGIVNRLRQVQATGRIVLDLPADARDVSQLPDMPLENGDRFIVPRVPLTVSVNGAVYNQNSFLYNPQRRVGGYIRLAGGANRDSDKNRAYVIRADGSVLSKQYSSSLRGSGFDSIRLYPGDTVVVPLNLTKGQGLRTLVDVAQIVGQFGIAIAAANLVF
jgi:protein involved in polysaccharide export with SLBB domain